MHNKSYRFSFLVAWCFLLSLSIVIMVAMIVRESKQRETPRIDNGTGNTEHAKQTADSVSRSVDYIQLVWGNGTPWKHSLLCFCDNTSIILQNDSVRITTGGFYHIYAHLTFQDKMPPQEGTVTLVANENVHGKIPRKLSEADRKNGMVSLSGVFRLRNGDSVKLNISPASGILREPSKTYWGLFLLAKGDDE